MASSSSKMKRELERLLEAAQRHSEKGRTDKAVAAYRELARLEPHKIKHWLTIGYLEGKRGNFDEAAAIYRKLGNYYDSHGKTAKAIAVFRQVLAPCPWDTGVHLKLAELQLKQNRPTESWQHYRQALALLLREERLADAVQVLVAMTELAADNVALWIRLAETAVSAGNLERAVSAFTTAMALLRDSGRTPEYIRVAERLSGLTPDNLLLVRELGAQYLDRGDVAPALANLHRCINANPRDVETLNLLVDAFLQIRDLDKAVNVLRLLADLHLDQGDAEQHALTCQRLLALGSPSTPPTVKPAVQPVRDEATDEAFDESSTQLEEGTLLEVATLLKEAAGYTKIGLFDGAADALHQARVLDATHEEVFEQLKTAYLKLGSVDDAVALIVDHAQRIADREPNRATGLLDEAQELNPDHPAVFRARMGPLDPHDLDSRMARAEAKAKAEAEAASGAASTRSAFAEPRWANEGSSLRLMSDIKSVTAVTAVTVKRPLPPDITVKINVDDLERTLLDEQRMKPHRREGAQQQGAHGAQTGVFRGSTELSAQPSSPSVFQTLTTGEIDLMELREVLGMDAAPDAEAESAPVQGEALSNFKPETTSPNALALSQRWRHLETRHDGE